MDVVGSLLKSGGKSIIGQTERAVVTIYDIRPKQRGQEIQTRPIEAHTGDEIRGGLGVAAGISGGLSSHTTSVASSISQIRNTPLVNAAQSNFTEGSTTQMNLFYADDIYENITPKHYHVQFNPSTIQIRAQGGGLIPKMDYQKGNGSVSYDNMETRIEVSIPLIFDKVVNKDAFMMEKFTLNPMEVMKGAASAAKLAAAGSDAFSVQREVEAFIAAVRNVNLSYISFAWGELFYAGLLNQVSCEYKMFDLQGRPVRAVVNLSLVCYSEDDNMRRDWMDAYDRAFVDNAPTKKAKSTL